ncbi:DNA internalization-related competence protein ComEC/Rec2 [Zhongshania sp.]|uniref:DNA internalization-related competence protein ComEC/Rec2 n=1 Tax=Zhongshania sp. TaxID=1971902 RepID=UPI001B6626B5|nr:DNA internalization-related competence protein ComEC/Rec2 [Zhongshania sp.]MBQ0794911.1 DNA internalization-related competence protein ComEC/Rec2 [Zhongshania sp.]
MLSWMTAAIVGFIAIAFAPELPSYAVIATAVSLVVGLYLRLRSGVSLALLAFTLAVAYASGYGYWRIAQIPASGEVGTVIQVDSMPERRLGFAPYYRFDARLVTLTCSDPHAHKKCAGIPSYAKPLVQLNWYAESPPQLGDLIKANVQLRQAHGYQSPGAFDYGRWMFANGYSATGYIRNPESVEFIAKRGEYSYSTLRQRLLVAVAAYIDKYQHGNIMKALLFADRSDIDREQWQIFSRTGTSHLMAISGMHIGLVLAWGFFIGRGLGVFLPRSNSLIFGAGIALCFAASYAALAGFSVPTQRALIMSVVALLALCWRRNMSLWQGYLTAMLLVLILDPLAPHRAGFGLSFAAVGVLLFAFQGRRHRKHHLVLSLVRSQWVVLLGLIPLVMMWGYGVNPVSFPVNLFAIPLLTLLIMPLLFLGLISLSVSPSLADKSWQLADYLLDVLLRGLAWAAELIPQVNIAITPLSGVLLAIAILVLLLPRGMPARWLAILPLLMSFLTPAPRPAIGSAWVTILDVGQGLSVLVQTASKTMLYDVGPDFSSGFNTADAVVLPALSRFGVDEVDLLVMSHADNDHAGAAPALLDKMDVKDIYLGEPIDGLTQAVLRCGAWQDWQWDGVNFEFVKHSAGKTRTGNNASCVLRIDADGASMLLTGDIEKELEIELLSSGQTLSANLLIAPHHGSNTSSSSEFIRSVAPAEVVFSAGHNNHYGHPTAAVTQRYQRFGARCWSTAYHGSMRFKLANSAATIDQIWGGSRYYWQTAPNSTASMAEMCSNLQSER